MAKKTRRRGKGEGSIYQLPSGAWRASMSYIRPDGSRGRKAKTCRNQASAVVELDRLKESLGAGVESPAHLTVGVYLDGWIETVVKSDRSANTVMSYRLVVRNHILPHVGGVKLAKFAPSDVQRMIANLAIAKAGDRTRQLAYVVLSAAMKHAISMGLIGLNPCAKIAKPQSERKEICPFSVDEVHRILAATRGTLNHAPIALGLLCGMRQGEIFGMRPDRISWEEKSLRVDFQIQEISGHIYQGKPKTKASIRTIEIPDTALDALRDHRRLLVKHGLAKSEMFFPATEGGCIRKGNFRQRAWNPLLKRLKLKQRGFHHTRHTYATLALSAGVPVHVVAKVLGHSSPSVTMDIYAHVLKPHQKEAASAIDRIFSGYSLATSKSRKSS
jgi:integrase